MVELLFTLLGCEPFILSIARRTLSGARSRFQTRPETGCEVCGLPGRQRALRELQRRRITYSVADKGTFVHPDAFDLLSGGVLREPIDDPDLRRRVAAYLADQQATTIRYHHRPHRRRQERSPARPAAPRRHQQRPHRRSDQIPGRPRQFCPAARTPPTSKQRRRATKGQALPQQPQPRTQAVSQPDQGPRPRSDWLKTALQDQDGPADAGPRARAAAVPAPRARLALPNRRARAVADPPAPKVRDDPFGNRQERVVAGIDPAPLRGTPPDPAGFAIPAGPAVHRHIDIL